jgi:hypothetical protein
MVVTLHHRWRERTAFVHSGRWFNDLQIVSKTYPARTTATRLMPDERDFW